MTPKPTPSPADRLRELHAKTTFQNLDTAEVVESGEYDCPLCGDGTVEGRTYTNYDNVAIGVQFFGIGEEHKNAEAYFRAVVRDLPALLSDHARLVEEIGRLREAATALLSVVDAFHDFCHDPKRPCGEYGVECPIGMGEWVETADKDAVARARAALSPSQKEGGSST